MTIVAGRRAGGDETQRSLFTLTLGDWKMARIAWGSGS